MRRRYWLSGFFAVLLTLALVPSVALAAPPADVIPGQYIVVLRDGIPDVPAVANEHARRHGAGLLHIYEHALRGYAATIPAARLAQVKADPRVLFISEDREVHTTQIAPTGIRRIGASTNGTSQTLANNKGSGVGVAVIDTGIQLDHPDLKGVQTKNGTNCIRSTQSANDDNGHGTHVAGTIAARDNLTGVVGVAPGATLYAVKVLDRRGSGSWSAIACGIDWVTKYAQPLNIKVANMSLGGGGSDDNNCGRTNGDAMHIAICGSVAAGVTYTVAAGNSSADAAGFVPAAYDEVITVSALADFDGQAGASYQGAGTCRADADDTFADFSNYGVDVDIIAPGVCINSTWKGGGYNTISGTSMAAPHVAGAAALYISSKAGADPATVNPATVKAALLNSGTTDWNNVDDKDKTKEPLLNVEKLLNGGY